MSVEYVALAVAVVSGIMVPIALTAVFPWVLSINSKVAVVIEKLNTLAARLEDDFQQHQQMGDSLHEHEKRLDDYEHRITAVEVCDPPAE